MASSYLLAIYAERAVQSYETVVRRNQKRFGANLRAARERAGLSQAEFSTRAGIAESTLSVIENGRVNLTISTMTKLASAVGAEVDDLLRGRKKSPHSAAEA